MSLNAYLSNSLISFIDAAIMRCGDTGETYHRFNLIDDQIRRATGRQRLHDDAIIGFFADFGIDCVPNPKSGIYAITLNLNECVLSPSQAESFATAKSYYNTTYG